MEGRYTCELCAPCQQPVYTCQLASNATSPPPDVPRIRSADPSRESGGFEEEDTAPGGVPRKLRILCLHGFRQSASSLKGRTASLQKKLRQVADMVFVDGPHVVPFVGRMRGEVLPEGGRRVGGEGEEGEAEADVAGEGMGGSMRSGDVEDSACVKPRFGWLIDPSVAPATPVGDGTWPGEGNRAAPGSPSRIPGPLLFSPDQYKSQRGGWDETLTYLEKVSMEKGPFDGLLGFSQGAAVAAAWVAWQEKEKERGRRRGGVGSGFKFVILCSGFKPPGTVWERVVRSGGGALVKCPSMHIFGGGTGQDRQIEVGESEALAGLFEEGGKLVVRHEGGHIIPTKVEYANVYRKFLARFGP